VDIGSGHALVPAGGTVELTIELNPDAAPSR
jgi:hypothetical protein